MKKISIGRIILSVLAMLLVAMGIFMLVTSYLTRRAFHQRLDANLMDIPVDISKPGTFSGPFVNICRSKHGQVLYLQVPPKVLKRITLEKVQSELKLDFLLTNPAKQPVKLQMQNPQGQMIELAPPADQFVPIAIFDPLPEGIEQFTLSMTIRKGIPELAGHPQRIVARYKVCGLEEFAAYVGLALAIGIFILAGLLLLIVRWLALRKREKRLSFEQELLEQ